MSTWTAQDWSIFILAVGGLIGVVGKFISDMATLRKKIDLMVTEQKIMHSAVNSQSERLNKLTEVAALAKGEELGRLKERADPLEPKKP